MGTSTDAKMNCKSVDSLPALSASVTGGSNAMAAVLVYYPAERLASCPSYGREAPREISEMNPHSANFRLHLEVSSKSGGLATKFEVAASHDGV